MSRLALLPVVVALLLVACPAAAADAEPPIDLILAVDVSLSMSDCPNTRTTGPDGKAGGYSSSDPDGVRWDGVQFLLDTANDADRVAVVLFRGDAVLLTAGIPGHQGGFVTMKDGRGKLKDAIRRVREYEQGYRDLPKQDGWLTEKAGGSVVGEKLAGWEKAPLRAGEPDEKDRESFLPVPSGGGERWVWLGSGTSNLNTLQAIDRWKLLVPPGDGPRKKVVMVFTDGADGVNPAYVGHRSAKEKWADGTGARESGTAGEPRVLLWSPEQSDHAVRQMEALAARRLAADAAGRKAADEADKTARAATRKKTAEVMKLFRVAAADVFTFGWDSDLDHAMLREVVADARPENGKDFRGAYYFARDSVGVFRELQRVGWELRGRWTVTAAATEATDGETRFTTPAPEACRDLGALVYTRVGTRARAPTAVKLPAGGAAVTVFESRSHTYLRFPPNATAQPVAVAHPPRAEPVCEFGLRPKFLSVGWADPNPSERYTLLDAVPVAVAFALADEDGTPVPKDLFTADMFTATARVFRGAENGRPEVSFPLPLTRVVSAGAGWTYAAEWDVGRAVRDAGGNAAGFEGEWMVEAEIRTAADKFKDHPLGQARRTLLRRPFRVGGYPGLRFADGGRQVSNLGSGAGKGTVTLELATAYAPDGPILLPSGLPLTADARWAADGLPALATPAFTGTKGRARAAVPLDFTRFDWAKVPAAGRRIDLTFAAQLPTGPARATAAIDLEKKPYPLKLSAPGLVFDLSGDPPDGEDATATDALTARLDTPLTDTAAVVGDGKLGAVTFTRLDGDGGPKSVVLKCELKPTAVRGLAELRDEGRAPLVVSVSGTDGKRLPAGRYRATLNLAHADGSATQVTRTPLTLTVLADQLRVRFTGVRDDRLEGAALAGTTAVWPVELNLALAGKGTAVRATAAAVLDSPRAAEGVTLPPPHLTGVKAATALAAAGGLGARFDLLPAGATETKFLLALTVPPSVDDGDYRFPLEFKLDAVTDRKEAKSYLVVSDTAVAVRRYGLKSEAVPPIEVTTGQPATAAVVVRPEIGGKVRWTATVLDEPGATAAAGRPWHDAVELAEAGKSPAQCVLTRPHDPVRRKTATEPFADGRPKEFVLKVASAGLPPGRYRCRIRLTPTVDPAGDAKPGESPPPVSDAGAAFDLPVEVIVRGLTPTLTVNRDKGELVAAVTAVKAEVGGWVLRSREFPGWNQPLTLRQAAVDDITARFTASVPFPTGRGGPCVFELGPANEAAAATLTEVLPAQLELDRQLCADGETVTVRLRLTAAAGLPPAVVVFRTGGDPNTPFARVTLADDGKGPDAAAGDFDYAGQFTFPAESAAQFGEYEVRAVPAGKATYPTRDVRCVLGVSRKAASRTDTLEYSKGIFEALYGPDAVTAADLATVKVTAINNPRYRVQVRYLVAGADAAGDQFLKGKVGPTTDAFDPGTHLRATATAPGGDGADAGPLSKEVPVSFGVKAELSDAAKAAVEAGDRHASLENVCGVVLVVTVTGTDSQGNTVGWEGSFPYAVKAKSFAYRTGLVWGLGALVVLPIAGWLLVRWVRRKRKQNEDRVAAGAVGTGDLLDAPKRRPPTTGPMPATPPRPEGDPPPRRRPPPTGDLFD